VYEHKWKFRSRPINTYLDFAYTSEIFTGRTLISEKNISHILKKALRGCFCALTYPLDNKTNILPQNEYDERGKGGFSSGFIVLESFLPHDTGCHAQEPFKSCCILSPKQKLLFHAHSSYRMAGRT
jgi:hypothetical protein